jgi:hypothetical protein
MRLVTFNFVTSLLFLFLNGQLTAQEQLGLRLDNFSGINGVMLNPASGATSQFMWDVNIAGAGLWFNNNIGYLEKTNIIKVAKNPFSVGPNPELGVDFGSKATILGNVYQPQRIHFLSGGARVTGPSMAVNYSSGHSFGFFTNFRATASSFDIPKTLNPLLINNIPSGQTINLKAFSGAAMAWTEFGLNYSKFMGDEVEGGLSFGASLKFLRGNQAFYIKNYGGTNISINKSFDTLNIGSVRAETGFTTNYMTNPNKMNGSGFGIDLGMMMVTASDDRDMPYKWRIGLSLLDLGGIRFHRNTEVHRVETKEPASFNASDIAIDNWDSPHNDVINLVNQKLLKPPFKTQSGNNFYMDLPTSFVFQVDYAVMPSVFVNGLVMQRVPLGNIAAERNNLFAITPRYETRWLGASMPISLYNYNYKKPNIGLTARLAYLTIGTENLGSFVGKRNVSGTDFYVALKLNPFEVGKEERLFKPIINTNCYRF